MLFSYEAAGRHTFWMKGMRFDLDIISVTPGQASVVGRGLIVHLQPDDYRSQPVGNAGARMACAVIQPA